MSTLLAYFDSADINDEAMYFYEMHGFLTSMVVQSGTFNEAQILQEILVDTPAPPRISKQIIALKKQIEQCLLNGEFPDISSDQDDDSHSLWTSGFMQGVFKQEEAWFSADADLIAELTLPILSCSELVDDEMSDICDDDVLLDDMADKIPDCVIDLYLIFNTPEGQ